MSTKTAKPRNMPKNKKQTVKQKIIQEGAQQRQKVQEQVFTWQEHLFTQESVSAATLREAARWLQPQTYDEIVEERFVQSICGYPLCSCTPQEQESRYRISLSQRKVFDQSELASYCSLACLQKSKYYTMQLSEDPVWVRDLTGSNSPTIHVIAKEENFKQSVAQNQRQQQKHSGRSNQDLRQDYVQKLLSNVPIGSNNNTLNPTPTTPVNKLEMTIVEKEPVGSSPNLDFSSGGAHDAIEGYRIENKKTTSNEPTTILLSKLNKENSSSSITNSPVPIIMEKETELIDSVDIDPESLLDDAMETMMMLKKMNLDREPSPKQDNISQPTELPTALLTEENTLLDNPPSSSTVTQSNNKSTKKTPLESSKSPLTVPSTIVKNPSSDKSSTSALSNDAKNTKAAVAAIEAAATAAAASKAKKAKKRKEPEMSLFGKIWTMLDRMTTKSTRLYLTSLATMEEEGKPGAITKVQLLEEDGLTDDSFLRGHIFSEKVLESYGLIRSQLGIKAELEMDMVNLIRTFRFADATMVVLDSNQTYMISLVLFKTLATVVLKNETGWQDNFELCCRYIGQTSDMVDACVRVLKVAST